MTKENIDKDLLKVLRLAWTAGFTIQSDFARTNAATVAMASSRGLITTRIDRDKYGTRWLVTPKGLELIWEFRR